MSEKDKTGVPFEAEDAAEARLWQALGELSDAEPSTRLRERFYDGLDKAYAPTPAEILRRWLGFSGNAGWVTATAALVIGLLAGQLAFAPPPGDQATLDSLQAQVDTLNRSLILDRLESASPGKRLRGVIDAVGLAGSDAEIAGALLRRAVDDNVQSVQSAAIDALGPQLASSSVGDELMGLLEASDSPLVQLALVDLVLRYGNPAQIEHLLRLAEEERLHPDLVDHVLSSVVRNRV